jgi:membrane-bound lytic murein transglycosylase D
MLKRALVLLLWLSTVSLAPAGANDLPVPAGLEPNVAFWTRIYTEVDTQGGLLHDAEHLGVVYETMTLPSGASRRSRERATGARKTHYKKILRTLAGGKRSGLSRDETRVLALWPPGVSKSTLRRAEGQLRFQRGQADKFRDGLIRSGYWRPAITEALANHGVPAALIALPHVESSYNPRAYSSVGAAGIFQFMRSTGRLYMQVDHVVDERMNPQKAAVAAAKLLRDNHERLNSWPLAITAYNHGVGGMMRAVRKTGTKDLGVIARKYKGRTFGFASRNFYTEFLAAWHIHQNPERYFGKLNIAAPIAYAVLTTDAYYKVSTLIRALGVDEKTLHDHNLALLPSVWSGAKLVPKGYDLLIPRHALAQPVSEVLAQIPASERLARQKRDRFHKVQRGDTLSIIARRYHTTQNELVHLNNLRSRHRIRVGQVLRLPSDGTVTIEVARAEPPSDGIYRVRRGDNLSIISARFGVTQGDIVRWNGLRNKNRLAVGQTLRVAPKQVQVASAPPAPEPAKPVVVASKEPAKAAPVAKSAAEPAPQPAAEPTAEPITQAEPQVAETSEPADAGLPAEARVIAVAAASEEAVPDPSDYAVSASGRITVQAEETLGHYAEWLDVSASSLRRLNRMSSRTPLVIGKRKKLDFSRVTPEVFEQQRLEYHRTLQEEFFAAWVVTHTTDHQIRRGDSVWYLANKKFEVPIWLLRQYNPDIDFGALPSGAALIVPVIEPRTDGEGNAIPAAAG